MLYFKPVNYRDKACTGLEAFSLLVPDGWGFEGGVRWSADDVMMPATCGFKVSGNGITVQALPGQAFFWTSLPHVRMSHPVGSKYLGAMVCPPMGTSEFITDIMLPALRPDAEEVSIVMESPLVEMGNTLGMDATFMSAGSAASSGACVKVMYRQNDTQYEEELYSIVTSFEFRVPVGDTPVDYLFWMADPLLSFRAEAGRLDPVKNILQSMVYSFRFNPLWLEKSNLITLYLKDHQINKPYSLRQLSVDVDRAAIFTDDRLQSCSLRQSAYQWIAGSLSLGNLTGEYYDPVQQICVQLPQGYDQAWASDAGEYLLSNQGDFALDYRFTDAWTPMEPISIEAPVGAPSATPATYV